MKIDFPVEDRSHFILYRIPDSELCNVLHSFIS